jgi:coupling of ubiquitin conjugation to ER degradation protein 1
MGEVVNAIVAVAVIVFIFRWATSSSSSSSSVGRSATAALGFRPKNVTQQMVDQIHAMFPDIPADNIRFDLLRTGSVELTSNKILERGFLEAPPQAYFTLYPRLDTPAAPRPSDPAARTAPHSSAATARQLTLIERYNLENKVAVTPIATEAGGVMDAGGKATWEDTAEKREASLRERKAQMVLAARQRMLTQQQKEAATGSGSS